MAKNVASFEDTSGSSNKFYLICEGIVSGNAVVRGHAKIERAAQCMDNCLVCDDAVIEERAVVCDFVTVAEKGVVIAETVAEDDRYISKRTHS